MAGNYIKKNWHLVSINVVIGFKFGQYCEVTSKLVRMDAKLFIFKMNVLSETLPKIALKSFLLLKKELFKISFVVFIVTELKRVCFNIFLIDNKMRIKICLLNLIHIKDYQMCPFFIKYI
ncbi:hypothetical protein BpHYR1_052073 [Brachionus plicatilis]|uniref:Uncharacterized protein n=1 Tax=Brachionus plicatilis TaxID=10195 RepID=A0A3M7R8S4_BRAPC|nr:hypothetical protein BpHYR1_052073 [Brachionus plicatilis]